MTTSTLKTILENLCDDYGIGRYGTNTGTSASAITDDVRFGGADGAKDITVGCSVFVTGGSAESAPDDEEVRLSSHPKLSTGVMNLDPALTAALANNDTFVIAFKPLTFKAGAGPYSIIAKLNQVLTEFQFEKRIVPITSVTDGDMLASGTSDWTAVDGGGGSNDPTLAKAAASFPLGERVLRVTNHATGAGDYARSATIPVEENVSYYLEALGMIGASGVAADAGTLVLYDVTNGAAIALDNSVIDRFEPERLVNTVTMPPGCEQVQIRLTCTAVNDIIEWGYVIFRKGSVREFVLADRPQRVMKLGRLLIPSTTAWGTRGIWDEIPSKMQALGAGLWQYQIERSASGSLWYEEFVQPAALSLSTDTTQIPAEDVAAVTAEVLLRPLRNWSKTWAIKYEFAMARAAGVVGNYLTQNQTVVNQAPSEYLMLRA